MRTNAKTQEIVANEIKALGFSHLVKNFKVFYNEEVSTPGWWVSGICAKCHSEGIASEIKSTKSNFMKAQRKKLNACQKCALQFRAQKSSSTVADVEAWIEASGCAGILKNIKLTVNAGKHAVRISGDCGRCGNQIDETTLESFKKSVLSCKTNNCSFCRQKSQRSRGMNKEAFQKIINQAKQSEFLKLEEMGYSLASTCKKTGEKRNERSAKLVCLKPGCGALFERNIHDLKKSFRAETNGCPKCQVEVNGLRHRKNLDSLKAFVRKELWGDPLTVLDLKHENKKGIALCRCDVDGCGFIWQQQAGTLKHKVKYLGSNGCPACYSKRTSCGEKMLRNILSKIAEAKFNCEFDFSSAPKPLWKTRRGEVDCIVGDVIVIEIHGPQHYGYIPCFHGNDPDRFELQRHKDDWKRANLPAQGKVYIEVDMRRVKSAHQMRDQLLSKISEILDINKYTQTAEPILQRLKECLITWSDE